MVGIWRVKYPLRLQLGDISRIDLAEAAVTAARVIAVVRKPIAAVGRTRRSAGFTFTHTDMTLSPLPRIAMTQKAKTPTAAARRRRWFALLGNLIPYYCFVDTLELFDVGYIVTSFKSMLLGIFVTAARHLYCDLSRPVQLEQGHQMFSSNPPHWGVTDWMAGAASMLRISQPAQKIQQLSDSDIVRIVENGIPSAQGCRPSASR